MSRPTFMRIDLSALRHNLERVHELAPNRNIIAMVKANAYGHGLVCMASALPEGIALGVASIEEGIKLREAGISQPIVLMEGLFCHDELSEAAKHNFTLVVHHEPHVEMLEKATVDKPFPIWLKINTGMHRLGIDPITVQSIYHRLMAIDCIRKPIGLMSHFAEADDPHSSATSRQMDVFHRATTTLVGPRSLANSAAIISNPRSHCDWVRPGIMLYGASPFREKNGS